MSPEDPIEVTLGRIEAALATQTGLLQEALRLLARMNETLTRIEATLDRLP